MGGRCRMVLQTCAAAAAALCLLMTAVTGDTRSGPQTCWTHLGTVGTCQSLGRCSSSNGFSVVLQSLRSNVCFWRRNKPFVCCPSPGGPFPEPPRDYLSPLFTLLATAPTEPASAAVQPQLPEQQPAAGSGTARNIAAADPTLSNHQATRAQYQTPVKEMKMEDMPTVPPFPMHKEERDKMELPRADPEGTPQDTQTICGRADPVVLASAAEAEILRLLFPDGAPVVAVSGGAFPGAAFGQEARVTGGATSVKGRWPWMAMIAQVTDTNTTWLCGGTIIDQFHVLTAAHCVLGRPNVVQFGDHDLQSRPGTGTSERREIAKITLHPRYRPPRAYHDLAVVTLKHAVRFSRYVRPICLPPSDIRLRRGQTAKITGHGYTEFNSGELSPRLQEAQIKLQKRKICNASYTQLGDIFFDKYPKGVLSHVLCAGDREGGVDACQGDSGGPLMQHSEETGGYVQIGVISTGFGCGNPEFPGLYVSVKHHLDFIDAVMRSHPSRTGGSGNSSRADKPSQPSRADKPSQPSRADKPSQPSRADKPSQPSRADKLSQPSRADNRAGPTKAAKPTPPSRTAEMPYRMAKLKPPSRAAQPNNPGRAGKYPLPSSVAHLLSRVAQLRPASREVRPASREVRPAGREVRPPSRSAQLRPASREVKLGPVSKEVKPPSRTVQLRPASRADGQLDIVPRR